MDQLAELEACRICVTCYPLQDMDFIYIFQKNEEFQAELDFIQGEIRQWQLKIEENDGLPQRICANCFAKFCSIEAFRKECQLAQEKLVQTFSEQEESAEGRATSGSVSVATALPVIKSVLRSPLKQQQSLLTQTDSPLPLVGGNYAAAVNSSLEGDQQVLVPSSDHVVGLNDFPVFDQQFDHFDNPALMDSSSTLLDGNLIDPANPGHELDDFLPSQNLFNFDETAEPPSTGTTLPLVETEIPSIAMGGGGGSAGCTAGGVGVGKLMEVQTPSKNDGPKLTGLDSSPNILKHDLEDILRGSIIPTNAANATAIASATSTSIPTYNTNNNNHNNKNNNNNQNISNHNYNNLNKANKRTTNVKEILTSATTIKTEQHNGMSSQKKSINSSNKTTNKKGNTTKSTNDETTTAQQREDNASDNECDESNVNIRLKGLPYTCHYCYCPSTGPIDHLSFANDDTLSQHFFDKHDPNRPYNCPHCLYSYKTKRLRDNHVRLHHEVVDKIKKCNYCQKTLKGAIEMHQYNCQYVGDWECVQCKEKFPNTPLYRFRLHQRQHERKNLKCRMCDRSFMRKAYLEAHERMHKSDTKMQWHCGQCNTNFHTDTELKRHKNQYHNDERPVKCKECHQGFASIAFLQSHMLLRHSQSDTTSSSTAEQMAAQIQQRQHLCLKCNLNFATLDGLQRHLQESSDNGQCIPPSFKERRRIQRQGVFPCFLCPKRFHLRSQLDKHLNTHDACLRPFQCEQCYVRCRTVFELKQHVNVTHLNIKEFACDICGKCFGYKKDLRDHVLFHAEISVYCSEEGCDYACKNDKALRDHIRHKHRLLSCEYCQEKFTRQKLTVHLRNVHRTEIDVELAGESDNFYKSQLLNNNNDITQISFNLLNNTQAKTMAIASTTTTTMTTSISTPPSSSSSLYSMGGVEQTIPSTSASSSSPPSSSSSSTSCISQTNLSKSNKTTTTMNKNINDNHLQQQQQQLEEQQQQLPTIFVTDHNSNNLALNGFVHTDDDDMNLVSHQQHHSVRVEDEQVDTNIFLVSSQTTNGGCPSSSPLTNGDGVNENPDHHLDQYFMASLMDTEQEIIVS